MINKFISIALEKEIRIRAIKVALVVGTLLALINHFDRIINLSLSGIEIFKILITYTVPYGVSTYSQVMQRLEQESKKN